MEFSLHITIRKGVYYYDRRIPKDIVDSVVVSQNGTFFHHQRQSPRTRLKGKKRWKTSLRTRSVNVARLRAAEFDLRYDQIIADIRKDGLVNRPLDEIPDLTTADKKLIASYGGLPKLKRAYDGAVIRSAASDMAKGITEEDLKMVIDDGGNPIEIEDAKIDASVASEEAKERNDVVVRMQPLLAKTGLVAITKTEDAGQGGVMHLPELLALWIAETAPDFEHRARVSQRTQRFIDLTGDLPIADITAFHIQEFVKQVRHIPKSQKRVVWANGVAGAIKRAKADGLPLIGFETVRKHLEAIDTLLKFATTRHTATGRLLTINPAKNVTLVKPKLKQHEKREARRQPWTDELLKTAVNAVVQHWGIDERRWIVWLAMYQGMRANEICQLRQEDVVWSEPGFWTLNISDAGEEQSLKSADSVRVIPIHPKLIEIGFIEFATKPARERVFTNLSYRRGSWSHLFTKQFSDFKTAHITDDSHYTFNSFRHLWKDLARNVYMPPDMQEQLAGRQRGKTAGDAYGIGYPIDVLHEYLAKIDPIKDLSGVKLR